VRSLYYAGIGLLSALSAVFAVGILYGEATDHWDLGGALVGALLLAYSLIMLLLRKIGIIGPKKAER
jgi:hypothetical protein